MSTPESIADRIERLGLHDCALSEAHPDFPIVNAVLDDDRVYVSGQISINPNGDIVTGMVEADGTKFGLAVDGARFAAMRCLRAAASVVQYEDITKILEMLVVVHCEEGGSEYIPRVANGASELLIGLLGEKVGMGTRMAYGGMPPYGAIVEVKMTLKVAPAQ